MAKVQIKSERITPFEGIFHVRELFSRYMASIIDKVLGLRCASYGYLLMDRLDTKAFGLKKTSRIKAFVFKFISVPAKWIRTARHYGLNIYTHNKSYQAPFALTGGMKNLPVVFFIPSIGIKILILVLFNNILVFSNKMLVFFDRSIRIPRAHARIHKVFYPCNRCHLATLLENQRVTCGNEVTRVTTNGVFALNIHSTLVQR